VFEFPVEIHKELFEHNYVKPDPIYADFLVVKLELQFLSALLVWRYEKPMVSYYIDETKAGHDIKTSVAMHTSCLSLVLQFPAFCLNHHQVAGNNFAKCIRFVVVGCR
jgi:hypothetical protein